MTAQEQLRTGGVQGTMPMVRRNPGGELHNGEHAPYFRLRTWGQYLAILDSARQSHEQKRSIGDDCALLGIDLSAIESQQLVFRNQEEVQSYLVDRYATFFEDASREWEPRSTHLRTEIERIIGNLTLTSHPGEPMTDYEEELAALVRTDPPRDADPETVNRHFQNMAAIASSTHPCRLDELLISIDADLKIIAGVDPNEHWLGKKCLTKIRTDILPPNATVDSEQPIWASDRTQQRILSAISVEDVCHAYARKRLDMILWVFLAEMPKKADYSLSA